MKNLRCSRYETLGCGIDDCSGNIAHEGESFFYLIKNREEITDVEKNFRHCDVTVGLSQGCRQNKLLERIVKVMESKEE